MPTQDIYTNVSPAVASYDWFSFVSDTGYQKFYAGACADSASTKYFLTTETLEGDINTRTVTVNNTTTTLTFDISFQKTLMISTGEALINFSHTQGAGINTYVTITLNHVSVAGTVTSIGTIQTSTIASGGAGWDTRRLAKIPVTFKSFGVGEKLRLSFAITSTGVGNATFYFDPSSRQTLTEDATGATIGTDITLMVPFRTDSQL